MQLKNTLLSSMLFAALTFVLPAGATEILTTSYSGWFATTTGPASEWDFNIPNNTYNTPAGYNLNVGSFGPVNVTAPDGTGYNLQKNPGYGASSYITLQGPSDGVGTMDFSTPTAGLTAFELALGISGNTAPVTITLSDGETFTTSPNVGGLAIMGFSSATPITSFTLATSAGTEVQLADFYAGLSSATPAGGTPDAPAAECVTAIMIGSGLLFFGCFRKVYSNVSTARS